MISSISSALSGIMTASKQVDASAEKIANSTNIKTEGEQVDLTEEVVNIKISETAYKANLATIKTANEMSDEVLRLFDETV